MWAAGVTEGVGAGDGVRDGDRRGEGQLATELPLRWPLAGGASAAEPLPDPDPPSADPPGCHQHYPSLHHCRRRQVHHRIGPLDHLPSATNAVAGSCLHVQHHQVLARVGVHDDAQSGRKGGGGEVTVREGVAGGERSSRRATKGRRRRGRSGGDRLGRSGGTQTAAMSQRRPEGRRIKRRKRRDGQVEERREDTGRPPRANPHDHRGGGDRGGGDRASDSGSGGGGRW